jgi:hypothetical protein
MPAVRKEWRTSIGTRLEKEEADDIEVEVASEDSFPASDPPAFSGITGPSLPK